MRRIRILLATTAAMAACLAIAADGAAAQVGNLDKACKKGYVLAGGPGSAYDTDGNGFVCVDPTTGDIRDDKGQFVNQNGGGGGPVDENADGIICMSPDGSVFTDDDPTGPFLCPGDFVPVPAFIHPG